HGRGVLQVDPQIGRAPLLDAADRLDGIDLRPRRWGSNHRETRDDAGACGPCGARSPAHGRWDADRRRYHLLSPSCICNAVTRSTQSPTASWTSSFSLISVSLIFVIFPKYCPA